MTRVIERHSELLGSQCRRFWKIFVFGKFEHRQILLAPHFTTHRGAVEDCPVFLGQPIQQNQKVFSCCFFSSSLTTRFSCLLFPHQLAS